MDIKSSGNESNVSEVYLYPKKDFMKKYLFFFENELIKVENSGLFSDFCSNPIGFGCEL